MPRGNKDKQAKLDTARKNNVMAQLVKQAVMPYRDKPKPKPNPPKDAA